MGFTIEDALNETKELYQLTLLCGQKGCANAMSWVHLIEDTTTIQQLWGKELIVKWFRISKRRSTFKPCRIFG